MFSTLADVRPGSAPPLPLKNGDKEMLSSTDSSGAPRPSVTRKPAEIDTSYDLTEDQIVTAIEEYLSRRNFPIAPKGVKSRLYCRSGVYTVDGKTTIEYSFIMKEE